jgi:hypothetical protein
MVLFDATMLSIWLHPGAKAPTDAAGKVIPDAQRRVDFLIETLDQARTKIIIPTPALSELLVLAGTSGPKYVEKMREKSCFKIAPFDQRAAIECAEQLRVIWKVGKKNKPKDATWAKIKFDHQIVAIAKVEGVDTIYSDDGRVKSYAKAHNIETLGLADLPKAPMKQESLLDYEASKKD